MPTRSSNSSGGSSRRVPGLMFASSRLFHGLLAAAALTLTNPGAAYALQRLQPDAPPSGAGGEQEGQQEQEGQEEFNLFGQPEEEENQDAGAGGEEEDLFEQFDFGDIPADEPLPGEEDEEKIPFAFNNNADVRSIITTLADLAGKPVRPDVNVLTTKIMLVNTEPVTRRQAFNLLTTTLFENGVAVIDRGTYITVTPLMNVNKGDAPFYGPDDDIMDERNVGLVAEKAYSVRNGNAKNIRDVINELLPPTDVKITVDEQSNTIIALSSVGLLQRIQRLIDVLDVSTELILETFTLKYTDAQRIAQLIIDLYAIDEQEQGNNNNIFQPRGRGGNQDQSGIATTARIRVAYSKQRNSISVLAEPRIIEQIRKNIREEWDVPIDPLGVTTRVFELENSDAVKLRDLLRSMFALPEEGVSGVIETEFFGGSRLTQQRGRPGGAQEDEDIKLHRLAGLFSFQADEDKNRLIVTALTPEYFPYIEDLIEELDEESDVNAPRLYPLRYARAQRLAEQLNAIFAEYGSGAGIEAMEEGLTERSQESPFSGEGSGTTTDTSQAESVPIQFWWENAQPPTDERPISALIGKLRIVPVNDQNAILVMAPPEYRAAINNLIEALDQPRRQVLIAATIVEVSIDTALALGVRWGSSNSIFTDANPDNQIRVLGDIGGTKNDLLPGLFDTSVLEASVDLRLVLQALAEMTDVSILSNPRVFTSDNEEAFIFDGQDIPFIETTQITDTGQVNNSFSYKAVGITLAVRPHITHEGMIDLEVNLELSSITPGQTLFGGFIVDRRETATKVTIQNQETVVMSGILREQISDIRRKVPLLGDIPIIGELFRSTDKNRSNSELIAFITPIIIDEAEGTLGLSEREKELLRLAGFDPANLFNAAEEEGVPLGPEKEGFWWEYLEPEEDKRW